MGFTELDKFLIGLGKEVQAEILSHKPNNDADEGRLEG